MTSRHNYSNSNHVHSTLVTLSLIKFPTISEVPKYFPSENGCVLDVHNIGERNFSITYLINMTKKEILNVALSSVIVV